MKEYIADILQMAEKKDRNKVGPHAFAWAAFDLGLPTTSISTSIFLYCLSSSLGPQTHAPKIVLDKLQHVLGNEIT
jgi:hypothetical protein